MNANEEVTPHFKLPANAFDEGYHVELGDQRFNQHQWELIQLYAKGYHEAQMMSLENIGPASMQDMVKHFQASMNLPVGTTPKLLDKDRVAVRIELIREEFIDELIPALLSEDLVETADACIDLLYVVLGLLVEMGIKAMPLFAEVQRSNMSKLGADGKPIIAGPNDPEGIFEGRVKKGPNYFKPDLKGILESGAADLG